MLTSPFKVAFWAMAISFGLSASVALTHNSPLRQRLAFGDSERPSDLLVAPAPEAPVAEIESVAIETDPVAPTPDPYFPPPATTMQTPPILVASADPEAPLGIDAPAPPLTLPDTSWETITEPGSIVVPDPQELSPSLTEARIQEPASPSASHPIVFPVEDLRSDIASIRDEIRQSIDKQIEQDAKILTEIETVRASVELVQVAQRETEARLATIPVEPEPTYTVTSGDTPDRWTFRFVQTPLTEVFLILGEHTGWNVALSPQLSGEFTGEFRNVDPEQAFVTVLKAASCSIDRRGDHVHVRPRLLD